MRAVKDINIELSFGILAQRINRSVAFDPACLAGANENSDSGLIVHCFLMHLMISLARKVRSRQHSTR